VREHPTAAAHLPPWALSPQPLGGCFVFAHDWGTTLLWIAVPTTHLLDVHDLVDHVADNRPVRRLTLDWPTVDPPRPPDDGTKAV